MNADINKPIIGIIKRNYDNNLERYVDAIYIMGGIPLLIPNYEENFFDKVRTCDGILFTGGTIWNVNDEYILKYCLENNIPFLGICLGMQMIGNYFSDDYEIGIDKTIKINSYINHNCRKDYCHEVILKEGYLKSLFKTNKIMVNSNHNYKVKHTDESIIKGYSPDGVIEVIEIPGYKFGIGVQWHPEKMIHYDENSRFLFKKFIESCK